MIHLEEKFDGHIILYCKGHYTVKDVDFLTGLRRIWAVRCAFDFEYIDKSIDEYIANKLYKLFVQLKPEKAVYFQELLHKELSNGFWGREKETAAIEKLIRIYRGEIWDTQIYETIDGKRKTLIKLPKPQKGLFTEIVKGNDKYNDYKLVK